MIRIHGTLEELVRVHITDVAESGESVAVAFEQFDGEPIRVAVTGSLPPMDYVADDGSFAGFNTAILAEIGKRLKKNIELVQVDSVGRALALAQGNVDAVFWTRGMAGGEHDGDVKPMSDEEVLADRTLLIVIQKKKMLLWVTWYGHYSLKNTTKETDRKARLLRIPTIRISMFWSP